MNPEADPADLSMIELFRVEVGNQKTVLTDQLLALESSPDDPAILEALMRAAHSIKGAARIVNLDAAVKVAHSLEDAFEAVRGKPEHVAACPVDRLDTLPGLDPAFHKRETFAGLLIDVMLAGVDLLDRIAGTAENDLARWSGSDAGTISAYLGQLSILRAIFDGAPPPPAPTRKEPARPETTPNAGRRPEKQGQTAESTDAFLRITAANLNRVLAPAGEAKIETQRLRPFAENLTRLKRQLAELNLAVDNLRDALITQLLRNAIDHGFEGADERRAAGKAPIGRLALEARHSSGKLLVSVADDGRGIDYERLRSSVVRKRLTTGETAARLSDSELLEFLFLPGFSQKEEVTEISGRGVGLDIVYNMVKSVRGAVRVYNTPGAGTRFELQLPLTLSVLRGLLANVNGQPYAFPLAEIQGTLKLPPEALDRSGALPTALVNGTRIEVVPVSRIFDQYAGERPGPVHVILIGDRDAVYALQVDGFLGERELVVQPLDPRLGKIQDISAGALMDDGDPVLIVDVQDLVRGAERLCQGETVFLKRSDMKDEAERQRVLVADDSLTVREMERQLLASAGYDVTVAIDGVDAWNAIRSVPKPFHLIVTDMDMPRMSGVELCELIRADPSIGEAPIIMITYKDQPEARQRAIDAGVDLFQTKADFDDNTFLADVARLIARC